MDKAFVNKVQQIILNHIEDEKLNVNILSFEIGLSRSQVWRKVKALTGKSVSQFICEVRLKEAAKLIQKDEFTAAEIAYKVGFNSPSYFHKCFHDHFGVTPGDYKTEKEESDNLILKTDESNKVEQQSSKSKKFILYSLIGLLIIALAYYFYNDYTNKTALFKKNPDKNSIAVLPFKDLSSGSDTQWFCDGITDNILLHISPLKKLLVISNTSSGSYKGTDKKIPEIMKELDVDYILEGSVTKHNNKVKIIAQLINKNDEHIWSKEYTDSFDDIFAIQQNVSKEIAKKLIETLSPEEEKSIGKNLTDNKEAYQLYLKAISLQEIQTKEDVEMSIRLYQQAIDLDSNFAAAYARMAGRYYVLVYLNVKTYEEVKDKINDLLKKALEIDPNSAMVYMEKGTIDRYEFNNWESAGENFKKALELDPNDPWSHFYYGIYLKKKPIPDIKNYLKHLKIAQRLEPLSIYINNGLFYALLDNDKIIEAEEFYNKTGFVIRKKNNKIYREAQLNVYKNKDWMEAIRLYEKELEKDPNNSVLNRWLAEAYDGILNDDKNAVKYYKNNYQLDSINRANSRDYFYALVEGEKFAVAKKIMESKNFKSLNSEKQQLMALWWYYYHQENYIKAQEILIDSLMAKEYTGHLLTYAQLGDRKKIDSLFINKVDLSYSDKAFVYAILKEKDSMYHYLGKIYRIKGMKIPNSRREFDPYRKEERYKELLKKNYLPITHWNE